MAERGDVLRVTRRLGFGGERSGERAVVIQADPLNSALPTTLIVPLDTDRNAAPRRWPFAYPPPRLAQMRSTWPSPLSFKSRFSIVLRLEGSAGFARTRSPASMIFDEKLRLVLDL
jgi:hypothetical protein